MHKAHQTWLTNLSNQLKQQHAEQMEQLKQDYEGQLAALRKQLPEKAYAVLEEQKAELENKLAVRFLCFSCLASMT